MSTHEQAPEITATLVTPHTHPLLRVTVGAATVEIPIDLNAVIGRRLLRRKLACAPVGDWRRTRPGAYTVAVRELPGRCDSCVQGCECRVGRNGCEHLGCRGVRSYELADSCPGAELMTASARQLAARAAR